MFLRTRELKNVYHIGYQKRSLWAFLDIVFNRYDEKRVKEVGADRACAEWLLRNGAKVVFEGGEGVSDYNEIVKLDPMIRKRIVEIDGSDSPITHHGFEFLKGCIYLRKLKLNHAINVGDEALTKLKYAEPSLRELEIGNCGNISDQGVLSLRSLKFLKILILHNLIGVRDWKSCEVALKTSLTSCQIEIDGNKIL